MSKPIPTHVIYPVPAIEVKQLEDFLKDHSCFCTIPVPAFDPYRVLDVCRVCVVHDSTFMLIQDRNALSYTLELIDLPKEKLTEQHKKAAAVMAFAIITGMAFYPIAAVGETTMTNGTDRGHHDTAMMGALQNLNPQLYLDVMLGRTSCIGREELDKELSPKILRGAKSLDVNFWREMRPHYGAALKLASLLHSCKSQASYQHAFQEFLRWSYEEFLFLSGAVVYGSLACSPNRRKEMFKSLRSGNWELALNGVRNAAWDMGLIDHWAREIQEGIPERRFVYFSTFDQTLAKCAKRFLSVEQDKLGEMQRLLIEDWGAQSGKMIFHQYAAYARATESPVRKASSKPKEAYWSTFIDDQERDFKRLASTTPTT